MTFWCGEWSREPETDEVEESRKRGCVAGRGKEAKEIYLGVEARSRPLARRLCARERSWVNEEVEADGEVSSWEERKSYS